MNLQERTSGILMPISSLPGSPFCGTLGSGARRFADFLQRSGQHLWQMLPINPMDECFSPYASISTFAADSVYIDLADLRDNGLLDGSGLVFPVDTNPTQANYPQARKERLNILSEAFQRYQNGGHTKYHREEERFLAENPWVQAHAAFCVLSEHFQSDDWTQWEDVPTADENAVRFHTFLQLVFAVQWEELHNYCRERGISLIGDVPIYVSKNSVDTWANPQLFQLDEHGQMTRVAGVPGDSFNPDGQRWNAPLYHWENHKKDNYSWWMRRIGNALKRFDAVRLDHFIGFYNYYSMPLEHNPDDLGEWQPGPADHFFDTLLENFPQAQLIAEDLGVMNRGVHQLRDRYHFPGINVFQFFFDFRCDTDKTEEWKVNSLACTGTHDTNTLAGWTDEVFEDKDKLEPFWNFAFLSKMLRPFSPTGSVETRPEFVQAIVRKVMSSRGNTAIFPMQDILGFPKECRMNFPGHADGNWGWRLDETVLTDTLADKLRNWAREFGR